MVSNKAEAGKRRMRWKIVECDPQGSEALALLRAAALEARRLYPELHRAGDPWPTNPPTPPGGIYLIAYSGDSPVAMGALRPIDATVTEVRRMFTIDTARRSGAARAILVALESHASSGGFSELRLETGNKQLAAMALYESLGFVRIPPFGPYEDDPTSICFSKRIGHGA